MSRKDTAKTLTDLPEVNFSDYGDVRFLHLGTEWVQGSMLRDAPYDIELEYVQRMMVGLLFMDASDRKSTRLNSSHIQKSRMPSSA